MDSTILSAMVATGFAALFGVIVGQSFALLNKWLDKKNARQDVLREKYEELVNNIDDATANLLQYLDHHPVPISTSCPPSETIIKARKAYTLSLIYFPLLAPLVQEFMYSTLDLSYILYDQNEDVNSISEEFEVTAKKFRESRAAIDKAITKYAETYT